MLPQFPSLKKLEVADKATVEVFTRNFSPYSDFNFVSMWSWDTSGKMALSQLNGNLVLRFTDYITGEPFYSFIGTNAVDVTATTLLEASVRQGLASALKLIPNDAAVALNKSTFSIEDEPEHADYVVSVQRLRTYDGHALANKRTDVRRFLKDNPAGRLKALNLRQRETHHDLKVLLRRWFSDKNPAEIADDEHELIALSRCLEPPLCSYLTAFGVFIEEALIAFWLLEDIGKEFGISHFEKADTKSYRGIVPFLRQQAAHALHERGIRYINMEQDLGIEGLRVSKASYAPDHYLKKYSVRFL